LGMFVRQKRNKSGKISVQVIDKSTGGYRVLKTVGCSSDERVVFKLVQEAEHWIIQKRGIIELDFDNDRQYVTALLDGIESLENVGIELLLGKIFDEIGFNQIKDELFRVLVLSRLSCPVSKLKTTDYLSKYHNINIDVQTVYRYMDKLHSEQKGKVQEISYRHTLSILDNKMNIVFYDVTTMYFEIESEDDIRKAGFSKEGKHQNPQIVLGLLVSKNGYPLSYEIFEGNKFEGHTMMPVIKAFKEQFKIEDFLVVADAGLLSNDNINALENEGYQYILGARLKNEAEDIKKAVLELKLDNGQSAVINAPKKKASIVVSYSDSRAKKDAHNRERGIEKLKKQIKTGKLSKKNINNRGYNKFLKLNGEVAIEMDEEKIIQDGKWDGLKGYITNSKLSKEEVIENYNHLWQIEKAFRVSKTDLKVRPIFHRVQRRIEAHICITFAAYKVYKELERQLKDKNADMSPEKAIDIARTIMVIKIVHHRTREVFERTLMLRDEQKNLAKLFGF
jgi:transposase